MGIKIPGRRIRFVRQTAAASKDELTVAAFPGRLEGEVGKVPLAEWWTGAALFLVAHVFDRGGVVLVLEEHREGDGDRQRVAGE